MANSLTADNHKLLNSLINRYGYQIDDDGICFGLSHMAMQAIEAGQISIFDKRIRDIILERYPKAGNLAYKELRNEGHKILLGDLKNKLSENYILLQERSMQYFSQSLSKQEKIDLIAFFDGIASYQDPKKASELSPTIIIGQRPDILLPIFTPSSLDVTGGISSCAPLSANMNLEQLTNILFAIHESVGNISSHPKSFIVSNVNHAITIGYDPKKLEWYFIDSNNLPVKIENNLNELSKLIFAAFKNETQFLMIKPYFLNKDGITCTAAITNLQDLILKEMNNDTSLEQAYHTSTIQNVFGLICYGENINSINKNGESLLHLAVEKGDVKTCRGLARFGADIHLKDNFGLTPLERCEKKGDTSLRKIIIEANAECLLDKIKTYIATHKWELSDLQSGKEIQLNELNKIMVPPQVKAQWDIIKEAETSKPGEYDFEDALRKVIEIGHIVSTPISLFQQHSTSEYYKQLDPRDKEALIKFFNPVDQSTLGKKIDR